MYTPKPMKSEISLKETTEKRLIELYGSDPRSVVKDRFENEWTIISRNGYAILFETARSIIIDSRKNGYNVELASPMGSSFISYLAGITEANPLPPHYRCAKCGQTVFPEEYHSPFGAELPDAICSCCGEPMLKDGYDLPVETLWSLQGDRCPDTEFRIGEDHLKQAIQAAAKVLEAEGVIYGDSTTVIERLKKTALSGSTLSGDDGSIPGKKRDSLLSYLSNMQAYGGSVRICFFPFNVEDVDAGEVYVTMLSRAYSMQTITFNIDHGQLVELDYLEKASGIKPSSITFDCSEGSLPSVAPRKYGENNGEVNDILSRIRPKSFPELVRAEGLVHSVGAWKENGEGLLSEGILSVNELITCREDMIRYLLQHGMQFETAFNISEAVRKGRFRFHSYCDRWVDDMIKHGVKEQFIESIEKISYLFTRSTAIQMAITDYRIEWFKAFHPEIEVRYADVRYHSA